MIKIEQETIDLLREGDSKTFDEIFIKYKGSVFFMAMTHFKNESTSNDIVQEVFMELYKRIEKIETPQALTIWINKITYTKCMNEFRRKSKNMDLETDDIEVLKDPTINSDLLDVINRKNISKVLQENILKMSPELRTVGLLRFYEELSIKDIADILGIPEGTVKSRIHTIKKQLKKELRNNGILRPQSIIPLFPMNLKGSYSQLIEVDTVTNVPVATLKIMITLLITTTLLTSLTMLIKNIDQEVETNISVDTKYTNADVPIHIETNQDYDYYLINGLKNKTITNNGDYIVTLIKDEQEIYKQTLYINNIDKEVPQLIRCEQSQQKVYIYIKEEMSGINKIECKDTNQVLADWTYDKNNQCISFEIKQEEQYIVNIDDYAGNTLEVNVSLGEE